MITKDKKKKLRGLLAKIDPATKGDITIRNIEDDVKDIEQRLSLIKDHSSEIFDLQVRLEVVRNAVMDKMATLADKNEVLDIKESYINDLNSFGKSLTSLLTEVKTSSLLIYGELETNKKKTEKIISDLLSEIDTLRIEIKSKGGGSIPLQVSAGGTVANKTYAEINFVGATASTNTTTRKTDITINTSGLGTSWARDTFSGNGSTVAFTLSQTPVTNSVNVYYNGNRQISGSDYSLSGTTLTFLLVTPFKGDTIEAQYAY